MKKPTQKQTEVLLRIAPEPLGYGMKINEAAKDLNISKLTAYKRLQTFKKSFPEAWENFKSLREVRKKHRFALRWKRVKNQEKYLKTFTELSDDKETIEWLKSMEESGKIERVI